MSEFGQLELRESASGTTLTGYAATFDHPYEVGNFQEIIKPGAFKRSISNPRLDVQLLIAHAGLPLARTTSGTMKLTEDHVGLHVKADLDPSDPDVQSLAPKIRRGDLSEMSFAFRPVRDEWNSDRSVRNVLEVDLDKGDVSVVPIGANRATSVALRGTKKVFEERRIPLIVRAADCETCDGSGRVDVSFSKACPDCSSADDESLSARSRRRAAQPTVDRVAVADAVRQRREIDALVAWAQSAISSEAERALVAELRREKERKLGEREKAKRAEEERLEEMRRSERLGWYG